MGNTTDLSTHRALRFLEEQDGTRHALPPSGSVTVGRAPAADGHVQVQGSAEDGLEERHCAIGRTKTGGVALKDLGSRAGCRVNGAPVTSQRLSVGDQVQLGEVSLWVRDERQALEEEPESSLGNLDGYRLMRRLGRGGMGDVVLAVQESLERKVALKLLKPSLAADKGFVHRFQAEAKNAAALSHPHVVHVYDVGFADGRHYLSMEFMEGGTLEGKLATEGPLPIEAVHRVLFETAQALAYAEERGIVHRDLKPDNLMLDATGRVKLADLGLAAPSLDPDAGDSGEASDGPVMGTPHFMAPEQARGAKPDHRADLYALGATAFRLLTGDTPFHGETKRDILRAHFTSPVPRASERRPELSPALDPILTRLMAKEPGERFPSAQALIAALGEVRFDAAATGERSRTPWMVGLLLLAVAAGAFVIFGGDPDDPDPDGGDTPVAANDGTGGQPAPEGDGPGGPALPAIPNSDGGPPEDDEAALEALEAAAQDAYRQLEGIEDPEQRRPMLLAIVQAHPGTNAASDAFTELQALDAAAAAAAGEASVKEAWLASQVAILDGIVTQAAALPSGAPSDPIGVLHAIYAIPVPAMEPADITVEFGEARTAHASALLKAAHAEVDRLEAAAGAAAAEGDFEAYAALLQEADAYVTQRPVGAPILPEQDNEEPAASELVPETTGPAPVEVEIGFGGGGLPGGNGSTPPADGAAEPEAPDDGLQLPTRGPGPLGQSLRSKTPPSPRAAPSIAAQGPSLPDGTPELPQPPDGDLEPGIAGGAGQPTTPDSLPPSADAADEDPTVRFALTAHVELMELGLEDFLGRSESIQVQLSQTIALSTAYHEAQVASDFKLLGQRVFAGPSGTSGLGDELRGGDFASLSSALTALAGELATDKARAHIGRLAMEAGDAADVLEALAAARAAGEWRRLALPQPSGGFAESTAFSPQAMTLETANGSRTITWRDFREGRTAENLPEAYEDVFKARLQRDYSAAELTGIATIMRFAAAESAILIADGALIESDRERFGERDVEDVQAAFDIAQEWAALADAEAGGQVQSELTATEREAATWLAQSLLARSNDEAAVSAALTRQLLMERPFSLTALLLSNGRTDLPKR